MREAISGDKNPAKRIEVRAKISASKKGKKRSEAFKQKMALIMKGNTRCKGRKLTTETKEKIGKSKKGKPAWNSGLTKETDKRINLISGKIAKSVVYRKYLSKDTKIEIALQEALNKEGIKFEKHKKIIGRPDIFIEPDICIFADGDYWHANPSRYKADDEMYLYKKKRITAKEIWEKDINVNNKLVNQRYIVLRFWENEINDNISNCVKLILTSQKSPLASSL